MSTALSSGRTASSGSHLAFRRVSLITSTNIQRSNRMLSGSLRVKHPVALSLVAAVVTVAPAFAQRRSPVAPRDEQVKAVVNEAYAMFRNDTTGKNADYIPYLAKVDPKLFGIALVTTDNKVYTIGDVDYSFSIQSISKVFTLALAMQEKSAEEVFRSVGSEPTGRPFNSVSAVVDVPSHTGNPFVNAGAIATTSLISGADATEK